MRIGQGFDVHRFCDSDEGDLSSESNEITIGGVKISHTHELLAHSDGDVLLHALADALLGAIAAGDIGQHFPDTDKTWQGADSRALLRHVYTLVGDAGYCLVNADMTLIAERPKFSPHTLAMRTNIAEDLQVSVDVISVKATTTEKLGFTGRKEGIAAQAIVLLKPDGREPS